jgi:hypothetical protein
MSPSLAPERFGELYSYSIFKSIHYKSVRGEYKHSSSNIRSHSHMSLKTKWPFSRKELQRFRLNCSNYGDCSRSQWPRGLRHELSSLARRWDRGFESHSRYGCLCAFILCLWPDPPSNARFKAWTVFARSTLGSWVRIPLKVWMSVCVYSVFMAWSPDQEVLPTVYRFKKLKKRPRSNKKGL